MTLLENILQSLVSMLSNDIFNIDSQAISILLKQDNL
jgi:hypothetical protein